MKEKLMNAVTVELIDTLDYVPVQEDSGVALPCGGNRIFEKRDISEYEILELIDLDSLCENDLKMHKATVSDWVDSLQLVDFIGKPSLIQIYLMENYSASKIALVKSELYSAIDKGINEAFIIVDIEKDDLIIDWGLHNPSPEIEYLIDHLLCNDISHYEVLPDLEGIVNRHEPEPVMNEVSKSAPSTYILLLFNAFIWLLGESLRLIFHENYLNTIGIKDNVLIQSGEYWRLVISVFLHGDMMHLASNSLSLLIFGNTVERAFGTRRFLAIYFIAGLAGSLTSFAFTPYRSLGASGAIMGIGGALIYLWRENRYYFSLKRKKYLTLVFLVFYNIIFGLLSPGIDNFAHFGGFIGGFVTAVVLNPHKQGKPQTSIT